MNEEHEIFKIVSCTVIVIVLGIVIFDSLQIETENPLSPLFSGNQITDTPITNLRIEKLEKEVQNLKILIEKNNRTTIEIEKLDKALKNCQENECKEKKNFQNCIKEQLINKPTYFHRTPHDHHHTQRPRRHRQNPD